MKSLTLDRLLIEKSQPENIPYLVMLKEAVMTSEYKPPIAEDAEWERWRKTYCHQDFFLSLLERKDALVYHIGSIREPAGMMVLFDHGDVIELDDLLVAHTSAGRGVGKRLIKCALAYARVWRKKKIIIDIYAGHERTELFLAKHGFALEGESANDLGTPMHRWSKTFN